MGTTNHISTKWLGNMAFESNNPSGHSLKIDIAKEDGGDSSGLRPKALMLSSLAGCSGLDIAGLIKKMKLEVDEFHIETIANLTDEHPKYYDRVAIEYHFHWKCSDALPSWRLKRCFTLNKTQIQKSNSNSNVMRCPLNHTT